MTIEIQDPSPDVPVHIIRYIKEMIRLASLQDARIKKASVTFKDLGDLETDRYICEVGFSLYNQSILITKNAGSYFGAAFDASEDLFNRVRNNLHYN